MRYVDLPFRLTVNNIFLIVLIQMFMYPINYVSAVSDTNNHELPHPYNTISVLPFDNAGHFGGRQAAGLSFVIKNYKSQVVVEIGSYLGASTRYIAKLLPDQGIIYAVDHWLGNEEWQNQPNYQDIQKLFYQKFLSNVIHEGLYYKIVPMKMTSLEAAKIIKVKPDLVFLDGAHDYQSVYEDLTAWYPHVVGHGVLCGDDYNWGQSKPVKRAVDRFARENKLKVKLIADWFWYYEK